MATVRGTVIPTSMLGTLPCITGTIVTRGAPTSRKVPRTTSRKFSQKVFDEEGAISRKVSHKVANEEEATGADAADTKVGNEADAKRFDDDDDDGPDFLEVNVEINVSAGRAHALYIKQEGCASFTAEEDYGCNVGDGKGCAVRWLVHYDLFTGVGYWNTSGTLAAPFSTGNIEDTSDWMVGVQAHGVQPVEFSLWLSAQEREAPYIEQTCGRLDHFCPGEQRLVNRTISVFGTGEDLESAAPRAAGPSQRSSS